MAPLILSKSDYGRTNTIVREWEVTESELVDHFMNPQVGEKDGSYFLVGPCDGLRKAENMDLAHLVVLDCDSRLKNDTEVVEGAPQISSVLRLLDKSQQQYILASTHSHRNDHPRYRIYFFPDRPVTKAELLLIAEQIVIDFNRSGVNLAYAPESGRLSQLWYDPRVKDDTARANYVCEHNLSGRKLPVEKMLEKAVRQKEQSGLKLKDFRDGLESMTEHYGTGQWSLIELFLYETNNLQFMREILHKHGYKEVYVTGKGIKFLAPGSTSNVPGVTLFKGRDNKWRVVSYHGDHDPLSIEDKETGDKRVLDSLDVYTFLEHENYASVYEKLEEEHSERLLKHFHERFVYRAESNKVGDRLTGDSYGIGIHFNTFTASAFYTKQTQNAEGETKKKTVKASGAWVSSRNRATAMRDDWIPNGERTYLNKEHKDASGNPQLYWNSYNAPKWDTVDTQEYLHLFLEHMQYLVPDEADYNIFMQWIALLFQRPQERARFTPLHISHHFGTGRGWLVRLINELMGPNNCSSTKMKELMGDGTQFNEYLYQTRFCAVDEVMAKGNKKYEVDHKIRAMLTEPYLHINTKYGIKGHMRVYTSLFFMSNHRDCLVLPPKDRRMFVMECFDKEKPASYYNKLYGMLENKQFLREVYTYLMKLDTSEIRKLTRPPYNDAKARLVGLGASDLELHFREMLEKPPGLVWTAKLVQTYLNAKLGDDYPIATSASSVVKALCRNDMIAGYNEKPFTVKGLNLPFVGNSSVQLKVHPDFPKKCLKDRRILKDELMKTVLAVKEFIEGHQAEVQERARESIAKVGKYTEPEITTELEAIEAFQPFVKEIV